MPNGVKNIFLKKEKSWNSASTCTAIPTGTSPTSAGGRRNNPAIIAQRQPFK